MLERASGPSVSATAARVPGAFGCAVVRRAALRLAVTVVACIGRPSMALESEPVVFRLAARTESQIRVVLYDASQGPSAGIAGAQFQYLGVDGLERGTADADGAFTLMLTLSDGDYLPVWGFALGFLPSLQVFRVDEVRRAGMIHIGLQPAAPRVDSEIRGVVSDASRGSGAPIANATVDYVYYSYEDAFPEIHGSLLTDAEGRYAFHVPLGPSDYVALSVSAPGFATFSTYAAPSQVLAGMAFDVALAPVGGEVEIAPANLSLECTSSFDVTISNTSATGETAVILFVAVAFHYGEGVYGQEFTVDLSQIHFPLALASGDHITFPVTFHSGGQFPSRVTLTVVSGARNGNVAAAYFGNNAGCHPSCVGDCDGDGIVSIGDLVRGVALALGELVAAPCLAVDTNSDLTVSIAELVAAVRHALDGCEPGEATPTPTLHVPFTPTSGFGPTRTASPTATMVGTIPPTPQSDAVSALQTAIDAVCHLNGPGPTDSSARPSEHGYTLHCWPSPGHETRAELVRYTDVDSAAAQFAQASEPGEPRDFHDVPAAYWETPFHSEGADRYLVWQLGCWVVSVHSFDDTHFAIAPQPFALSEAVFSNARELLLAECPTAE